MRRLEAAPHVRMARGIEVHAFVPRALDADLLDARHIELFDIDMRRCPRCGGVQVKIIAAILERAVIGKILTHLGLDPQPPPRSKAREAGLEFAA
jgi:Zn-finger nucleic acid-binding protein